jgi:hypothetical protein
MAARYPRHTALRNDVKFLRGQVDASKMFAIHEPYNIDHI